MDKSDRKYIEKRQYPKKQMVFVAMGSCFKKPFVEIIDIGEKLDAKRFLF